MYLKTILALLLIKQILSIDCVNLSIIVDNQY